MQNPVYYQKESGWCWTLPNGAWNYGFATSQAAWEDLRAYLRRNDKTSNF